MRLLVHWQTTVTRLVHHTLCLHDVTVCGPVFAGTDCAFSWRDGQAELTLVA